MFAFCVVGVAGTFLGSTVSGLFWIAAGLVVLATAAGLLAWLTLRWVPNSAVGVVEKLWSSTGSVQEGHIMALDGEAGFQAGLLRGGVHFGLWRWQYRVHKTPLVTIPQGKLGYVYARDGEAAAPSQTLGHAVPCNHFQDVRGFLQADAKSGRHGRRGRQLAILREGVYAIAQFLLPRYRPQEDDARAAART